MTPTQANSIDLKALEAFLDAETEWLKAGGYSSAKANATITMMINEMRVLLGLLEDDNK